MIIDTKYHGSLEIEAASIFVFEQGLPGFLDEKKFVLLPITEDDSYHVLQSITNPYIAFVVVSPFTFNPSYEITIDDHTIAQLGISSESDVTLYSIMTLREPFDQSTMNLAAPIVVNSKTRKGKQMILSNTHYSIQASIKTVDTGMKG